MISNKDQTDRIQNFSRSDKKRHDKYDQKDIKKQKDDEEVLEEAFDERNKVIRRVFLQIS